MKRCFALIILAGMITNVNAGFVGLTHHSRANCLTINESISWDGSSAWRLYVFAYHYKLDHKKYVLNHKLPTTYPNEYTWRCAAIHYGESKDNSWYVKAEHWLLMSGRMGHDQDTEATNCNEYDGWWDKDHPERKSKENNK